MRYVRAVPKSILDVLGVRSLSEVGRHIVRAIAVAMKAFHSRRSWPDERSQNQGVNEVALLLAQLGQLDDHMTVDGLVEPPDAPRDVSDDYARPAAFTDLPV